MDCANDTQLHRKFGGPREPIGLGLRMSCILDGCGGRGAAAWEQAQDQMEQPVRFFHNPRVKSGNFTGALPWATEVLLKGAGADQAAPSYTSMSGGSPSRIHCNKR